MNNTPLVPRETPLEPKRVMSVFKERVEKHKGELAELAEKEALVEKDKPVIWKTSLFSCRIVVILILTKYNKFTQNVLAMTAPPNEEGHNYYEQYNIVGNGVIKLGDYVYVATDTGKQSIAQVQSIWDTKEYVPKLKINRFFPFSIPNRKI